MVYFCWFIIVQFNILLSPLKMAAWHQQKIPWCILMYKPINGTSPVNSLNFELWLYRSWLLVWILSGTFKCYIYIFIYGTVIPQLRLHNNYSIYSFRLLIVYDYVASVFLPASHARIAFEVILYGAPSHLDCWIVVLVVEAKVTD